MVLATKTGFRWRFALGLTLVVGTGAGLAVGVLRNIFGIAFPPILAGLLGAIIIMVAVVRDKGKP